MLQEAQTQKPNLRCLLRSVVQTVRRQGEMIVIDHVPAEVCSVCGDLLLKPEAQERSVR